MQPELIETILVESSGNVPLLARHLHRLETSCKALGYVWGGRDVEGDILLAVMALSSAALGQGGRRHQSGALSLKCRRHG